MRPQILLTLACVSLILTAQTPPPTDGALKSFLRSYVAADPGLSEDETRYLDAAVDLNGDGKLEVIVYLMGRNWCGTGGCVMLVLTPEGSSFKEIAFTTITRPPIRVLNRISHGWRSLSVRVRGGEIQPGYEAELQFDGKTYPSNPSVPPARRLRNEAPGIVFIEDADFEKGKSL